MILTKKKDVTFYYRGKKYLFLKKARDGEITLEKAKTIELNLNLI